MDEALGQEDARLLVTLQGGPVVVPADAGVFAQIAGRALEGQSVTLEDHLAQGRDKVVRVQLQGPFCGGGHQGSEARMQQCVRCRGQGRGVQSQEWSCTGAHSSWGKRGRRKPLEIRAQEGVGGFGASKEKRSCGSTFVTPGGGTGCKHKAAAPKKV